MERADPGGGPPRKAAEGTPAPAADNPLRTAVLEFSRRYLDRALTEAERETLDRLVMDDMRIPPAGAAAPDPMRRIADAVRSGQQAVDQTLARVNEEAARQVERAAAGADSETHELVRLLEKAEDLGSLRPSRLRTGDGHSGSHVLMAQIADRLANLVKKEVESLFQSRFGTLAQQLEEALAALPKPASPAAEAPPPEPPSEPSPKPPVAATAATPPSSGEDGGTAS